MTAFVHPRLRKPLGIALAGTVFAAAWGLCGGHAWWLSVTMEVTVLVTAITTYVRAGEDSDEGALAGSRSDERQQLLSLRSRALGWNFAMVAAFIGITVAVAVKATWGWPFLVILAVTGFAYLLGLSNYGVAEEGTADSADTGR
jgi:fatty acid desaturase